VTVPVDAEYIAEVVGIAELGMPIGPSVALRLCEELAAARAELAALRAAQTPAPAAGPDVPGFLRHRVRRAPRPVG
jgi:hypothetical protein